MGTRDIGWKKLMYAPVAKFTLREAGDRLVGYAAPADGLAPCLLRLSADGIMIAAARATGFSREARDASLRLGWCGVELPGLPMAVALGSHLEVRCGVSDRIIWQRVARVPITKPRMQKCNLTVFDIINLSRKVDAASNLNQIEPFFKTHLVRFGVQSYVNATYGTFLGRSAEPDALRNYAEQPPERVMTAVIHDILDSKEFKQNPLSFIPGPFNAAFRYDLGVIV